MAFNFLGFVGELVIDVVFDALTRGSRKHATGAVGDGTGSPAPPPPLPRPRKERIRRPPKFVVKASTTTELALVTRLGADPTDEGARMVYGDWLESHGMLAKASFVRGYDCLDDVREVIRATDAAWRASTSCQPITCSSSECPRRWSGLAPVDGEPWVRRCRVCTRTTRFCTDLGDLRARRAGGEQVLLDLASAIAK